MGDIAIFKSKKATMALACAILGFACVKSGFTQEQIMLVVGPMIAYLPIEGALDARNIKIQQPQPEPAKNTNDQPVS